MRESTIAVLLAMLLAFGLSQTYTGEFMPHLYTGVVSIDTNTAANVSEMTYESLLDRSNVFNLEQDLFIATALRDFGSQVIRYGETERYLHIEVVDPKMDGSRIKFIFNLKLNSAETFGINPVGVTHVSFSFIIVGSDTQGSVSDVPSSLIFARNGKLFPTPQNSNGLVDFSNEQKPSPFQYDYDPSLNNGAGAVKRNNVWLLQNSEPLFSHICYVFITGFQARPKYGVYIQISVLNVGSAPSFNLKPSLQGAVTYSADSSKSGITVTLPLLQQLSTPQFIQLSMISIAIRDQYVAPLNPFPTQNHIPDEFFVNIFEPVTFSDFFININDFNGKAYNVFKLIGNEAVSYPHYANLFAPSVLANFFYGLQSLTISSIAGRAATDFVGFKLKQVNLQAPTNTLAVYPATNANLIVTDQLLLVYFGAITITARPGCSLSTHNANPALTYSIAIEPKINTASFSSPSNFNGHDYNSVTADNRIGLNFITMEQQFKKPGKVTYTFEYQGVVSKKAYEGILHLGAISSLLAPSNNFNHILKVEVFGSIVYKGKFGYKDSQTIRFGFFNVVTANNKVSITYQTDYDETLNGNLFYQSFLQFGLRSHDKLLGSENKCVSQCSPVPGSTVGFDYSTVPPTCVACDSAKHLQFSPANGSCICQESYHLVNSQCVPCSITLCAECNMQADYCFRCVDNAIFVSPLQTAGCKCQTGYHSFKKQCVKNCLTGTAPCQTGSYKTSGGCQACPSKCETCLSASACTTCATGYASTGTDCIPNVIALQPVSLQIASTTARNNTVFITISPTIIPNSLPPSVVSKALLYVPQKVSPQQIFTWVSGNNFMMAAVFESIPTDKAHIILNSAVVGQIYQSIGYTTVDTFTQVSISSLPLTPPSIVIPQEASKSRPVIHVALTTSYSLSLNSLVSKALKQR